jgi:hypothetical protein
MTATAQALAEDFRQTSVTPPANGHAAPDLGNRKQFRHDAWLPADLHNALKRFAAEQQESEAVAHRLALRLGLRQLGYIGGPPNAR